MICWNEANTIDLALESIAGFADEVIIIDTGSFDGTYGIAQETLDKFNISGQIRRVRIKNLYEARLIGLQLCEGAWVLVQDANLVLSKSLQQEMSTHIHTCPGVIGRIGSLNLMGDYEHYFANVPFMGRHKILSERENIQWNFNPDRPDYIGKELNLSNWAVNLSRVRPSWRYWLRGEQFDRRYYGWLRRRMSYGNRTPTNLQWKWMKSHRYYSPLEYAEAELDMSLDDIKKVSPKWFLKSLQTEATPLTEEHRKGLPEVIKEELKNPRYKLIYSRDKIIGRYPEL